MANKEFQVRHGLVVNNNVLVANTVTTNVGIGTASPSYKLDVAGTVRANRLRTWNSLSNADWDAFEILSTGSQTVLKSYGDETGLVLRTELGNVSIADDRGNVGIGTASPNYKLDVAGSANISSPTLLVAGQNVLSSIAAVAAASNAYAVTLEASGNNWSNTVGSSANAYSVTLNTAGNAYAAFVGTSANAYTVSIAGSANNWSNTKLSNTSGMTFAGDLTIPGKLYITSENSDSLRTRFISGKASTTTAAGSLYLNYSISNFVQVGDGATATSFYIPNGNLGVGTASPASKLHVVGDTNLAGDVTISGNLTTSGTVTYANTQTLLIGDNIITLNADLPAAVAATENAGLEVNRGAYGNSSIIWDETNDKWDIKVNTSSLLTATQSGNVGIGTSTPNAQLELAGVQTNILRLSSSSDSANYQTKFVNYYNSAKSFEILHGDVSFVRVAQQSYGSTEFGPAPYHWRTNYVGGYISANTNSAERMRIDANGSLLIGSTTSIDATAKLQVQDHIALETNGTGGKLSFFSYGNFRGRIDTPAAAGTLNIVANANLTLMTSSTERIRITSDGNVGIGTTSPTSRLVVYGTNDPSQQIAIDGTGNYSSIKLRYTGADVGFIQTYQNSELNIGASGSAFLNFYTNNTERMRITSGGNVGINTTSPIAPLNVRANASNNTIRLNSNTSVGNFTVDFDNENPRVNTNVDLYTSAAYRSYYTSGGGGWGSAHIFRTSSNRTWSLDGYASDFIFTNDIFAPSANAGGYNHLYLRPTIVQTGTANGNYTAILVNVLETAAKGSLNKLIDLQTDSTSKFYVANTGLTYIAGSVGIGNTTPDSALHITGAGNRSIHLQTTNANWIQMDLGVISWFPQVLVTDQTFRIGTSVGTSQFVISNTGNIGIGTTTPTSRLDVAGDALLTRASSTSVTRTFSIGGAQQSDGTDFARLDFLNYDANDATPIDYIGARISSQNQTGSEYGNLLFHTYFNSTLTERMRITSAGNIGIGNTNPSSILHVASGSPTITLQDNNSAEPTSITKIDFGYNAGTLGFVGYDGLNYGALEVWNNYASGNVLIGTANTERIRITSAGNVGIGTSSPATLLDVNGSFRASTIRSYYYADGLGTTRFDLSSSDTIFLNGSGTERARITSAGNLGIGTTSPSNALDVVGDIKSSSFVKTDYIGNKSYVAGQGYLRFTTTDTIFAFNTTEQMRLTSTGNVGIGNTSPNTSLHIYKSQFAGVIVESGNQPYFELRRPGQSHWRLQHTNNGFAIQNDYGGFGANTVLQIEDAMGRGNSPTMYFAYASGAYNVGIGTTSPSQKLDVVGSIYAQSTTNNPIGMRISATANVDSWLNFYRAGYNNWYLGSNTNSSNFVVKSDDLIALTVSSAGNMGLGTTSPGPKLEVAGSGNGMTNGGIRLQSYSGDKAYYADMWTEYAAPTTFNLTLTSSGFSTSNVIIAKAGATPYTSFMHGNIGIGTTSPARVLEINNASSIIRYNRLNAYSWDVGIGNGTNGLPLSYFGVYDSTTGAATFAIAPTTGNIGIGTTSPTNKLTIQGSGDITKITNGSVSLFSYSDSQGMGWFTGAVATGVGAYYNNTNNYQAFYTASSERMRIDSAGNIGIGTSSPGARLELFATNDATVNYPLIIRNGATTGSGGGSGTGIQFISHGGVDAGKIYAVNNIAGITSMVFTTYNGEVMRLSDKSVGIGTTSPTSQLHVKSNNATGTYLTLEHGDASRYPGIAFNSFGGAAGDMSYIVADTRRTAGDFGSALHGLIYRSGRTSLGNHSFLNSSNTVQMVITEAGSVGIGNTAPVAKLDVYTSVGWAPIVTRSNTQFVGLSSDSAAGGNDIIFNSGNPLRFSTMTSVAGAGYTERMRIDASGNVGIGTTAPGANLDMGSSNGWIAVQSTVVSSSTRGLTWFTSSPTDYGIFKPPGAWGGPNYQQLNLRWITGIVIDGGSAYGLSGTSIQPNGGNVAIGAATAPERLCVYRDTDNSAEFGRAHVGFVGFSDHAGFSHVDMNAQANYALMQSSSGTTYLNSATGQAIYFRHGNADQMILTGGSLGIGNTSPSGQLSLDSATANRNGIHFRATGWNTIGRLGFNGTSGGELIQSLNWNANANSVDDSGSGTSYTMLQRGYVTFGTGGTNTAPTERMRIDYVGNIGIGTTSPTAYSGYTTLAINNATNGGVIDLMTNGTRHLTLYSGASTSTLGTVTNTNLGFISNNTERMRITAAGNVGIGTSTPAYNLQVNGSFAANTKSFVIDHPTKPNMKLRYGSLEGPENGVYVRGKCEGYFTIELPDYWTGLVDEDTITVSVTPLRRYQKIFIKKIENNIVHLDTEDGTLPYCHFTIFGERKDVEKLVVEFEA